MADEKPKQEQEGQQTQSDQETTTQSNPQTGVGRGRYKAARGRTPGAAPRGKPHRAAGGYGTRHN